VLEKEVVVKNRAGIHARPSTEIVKAASRFKSEIYVQKNDERVNAKSIMGLITLGIHYNDKLIISTEGEDEREALDAIVSLIERPFEFDK